MDMMEAVSALGDCTVKVVEVPKPSYGPYECLVKVTACGLCSSTDLKIISNGSVAAMKVEYPTLIGHEGVGVIEEVGEKVRYLKKGDRIVCPVGGPAPGYHFNWGGMNGYAVTHDIRALIEDGRTAGNPLLASMTVEDYLGKPIPDGMSDPDAVMLLTLKENYSALKNFGVTGGTRLLIYGDGAVALGLSCFAKLLGASYVVNIGHHDDRLKRISDLAHADLTINSNTQDVEKCIGDAKFDVVIDAVGSVDIVLEGARFLVPGGRVGVYGVLKEGHASLDLLALPNNVMVQILNWPYREHRTHDEVVKFVREGKIDPKWFYSHVLPIDEAQKGVDMIRNREAYKVIFTMV